LLFSPTEPEVVYVSRSDVTNSLAAWSKHGFELDGIEWPSVEHYYQGMKFEDPDLRDAIRAAPHPKCERQVAGALRGRLTESCCGRRNKSLTFLRGCSLYDNPI